MFPSAKIELLGCFSWKKSSADNKKYRVLTMKKVSNTADTW